MFWSMRRCSFARSVLSVVSLERMVWACVRRAVMVVKEGLRWWWWCGGVFTCIVIYIYIVGRPLWKWKWIQDSSWHVIRAGCGMTWLGLEFASWILTLGWGGGVASTCSIVRGVIGVVINCYVIWSISQIAICFPSKLASDLLSNPALCFHHHIRDLIWSMIQQGSVFCVISLVGCLRTTPLGAGKKTWFEFGARHTCARWTNSFRMTFGSLVNY